MGQFLSRRTERRLKSDRKQGASRSQRIRVGMRERCIDGVDASWPSSHRNTCDLYPEDEYSLDESIRRNTFNSRRQQSEYETQTRSHSLAAALGLDHRTSRERSRPQNTGAAHRKLFQFPSTSSRNSRREGRRYDEPRASRATSDAVDLNRLDQSRTRNTSTARSARPHKHTSHVTDGNIGTPRRQGKYVRGKSSQEGSELPTHDHNRTRQWDGVLISPASKREAAYNGQKKLHNRRNGLHGRKSEQVLKKKRGVKECIVCTDERSLRHFPDQRPTEQCTHDIDVCKRCLRTWIESEFSTKIWNEIKCPICASRMDYSDMRKFAPTEIFRR
jgi:hypothetical protein